MKFTVYTDLKKQKEVLAKILKEFPDAYVIFDAGDKPKSADEMFGELGYEKIKPTFGEEINSLTKFYKQSCTAGQIICFDEMSHYVFKSKEYPKSIFKINALTFDESKAIAKYIEEQEQ